MKLSKTGILDRKAWEEKGFTLPSYNREEVRENTKKNPRWVHFGAGNIFRAFQANLVERLLNEGELSEGLIVAEGYDYEIIDLYNRPCDDLSILVTLKSSGSIEKKVIGSIVESHKLDENDNEEMKRLEEIFSAKSLQMISFTITEKGYKTRAYMDKIVGLLLSRFNNGAFPLSVVSMDNCSHNGDKLKEAVINIANEWLDEGKCSEAFVDYLLDESRIAFPLSMIDKITPRPDGDVLKILEKDGVDGLNPVVTSKNTYISSFVNAEETEYLVIEDLFPAGRPCLDKAGVIFTDRETVEKVERMKVTTCLNPLHTALAIFGCLLKYDKISEEMKDEDLVKLVNRLGSEGMKVVTNPGVFSPQDFLDTVLTKRLPNPYMPDTPQRIACDTSQKLSIRFGETIKGYIQRKDLDVNMLQIIPFVFAAYLRYLDGYDDFGDEFVQSPDPLLEELKNLSKEELLKREDVFGLNLYETSLATLVLDLYSQMKEKGQIRKMLKSI